MHCHLQFHQPYLQCKEANLFQPACEFLPMIDEVCFFYNHFTEKLHCLVQMVAVFLYLVYLEFCNSSSWIIYKIFVLLLRRTSGIGFQYPLGGHEWNWRCKGWKQQVLCICTLPQRSREGKIVCHKLSGPCLFREWMEFRPHLLQESTSKII